MRKGGNGKFVWNLCITCHINVCICLYEFEYVLYNIICQFLQNSSKKFENKIQTKLKKSNEISNQIQINLNEIIENKIYQMKLKT
jgi:hypothetical protein